MGALWWGWKPTSSLLWRWGREKLQALACKAPFLFQIAFLPQIEHGLLESTASLGCVATLKENGWYLQHFVLFNYDHKIPDELPVEAHSSCLYFTTVSANFASPGTQFCAFKYKATWAVCKHLLFPPCITVPGDLTTPSAALKLILLYGHR